MVAFCLAPAAVFVSGPAVPEFVQVESLLVVVQTNCALAGAASVISTAAPKNAHNAIVLVTICPRTLSEPDNYPYQSGDPAAVAIRQHCTLKIARSRLKAAIAPGGIRRGRLAPASYIDMPFAGSLGATFASVAAPPGMASGILAMR